MFHNDGDGIGFGIENREKAFVGALFDGSFGELFVVAEQIERVFDIRGSQLVCHSGIFALAGRRSKCTDARQGHLLFVRLCANFPGCPFAARPRLTQESRPRIPRRRTPMRIGQAMLGEFDQEMQNTRKVLERLPEDKWNWKPHDKSGTVGWLAGHIATLPGWAAMTIQTEELDYAPVNGPSYQPP